MRHFLRWLTSLLVLLSGLALLSGPPAHRPIPGWEATRQGDHQVYRSIDRQLGTYVMVSLYDDAEGTGNLERDFASEWANLVATVFRTQGTPRSVAGKNGAGLAFREGSAQVRWDQGPAFARLHTFAVGSRIFSVLAVATHEAAFRAKSREFQVLLDSLRPGTGEATRADIRPSPGGGAPKADGRIAGVWMGFRTHYPDLEPRPRWYVFFEDGQVFVDLPNEGLAGFDRARSQANAAQRDRWGSYTVSGGSGAVRLPDSRNPETLKLQANGNLQIGTEVFHRCRSVDGLRLQGSWTSFANPQDPALGSLQPGRVPIFTFGRDGRFRDEGVFATLLWSGDGSTDGAGVGNYEIRDFSIRFRFDDGRTKQVAFSALLGNDPNASADTLFLGRARFNRRR